MRQTRTRTRNRTEPDPTAEPPSLPTCLEQARALIASELHHPNNLGVELLHLTGRDGNRRLVVYIDGLADTELVERRLVRPLRRLDRHPGRPTPTQLLDELSPFATSAGSLNKAVRAVVHGETLLLQEGEAYALVIQTARTLKSEANLAVPPEPHKVIFGPDLTDNLTMVRQRLRDPALIAQPIPARAGSAASAALLYMTDRASSPLLNEVTRWAESKNEEELRRGEAAGRTLNLGRLSTVLTTQWPDYAANLVDQGYVVLLADRIGLAYAAPVTAPALLTSPGDNILRRPAALSLRALRVVLASLALFLPGVVISILNYHEEMIPTPFLLALTASRESSAFPIVFEVLLVELLQEVFREATVRLPMALSPGQGVIGGTLLMLLLVQTGLLGPVPVFAAVLGLLVSLGLPNYQLIDLVRAWRFLFVLGAMALGLYGMTVVGFIFASYLFRTDSFGIPFIGEAGLHFDVPGKESSARV